jgi:hypothetical protein
MKKIFYLAISFCSSLPIFVFAQAGGAGGGAGGGGDSTGESVITNPITAENIPDILNEIINFMLTIAGPIAVVMTIYAAYLFITAGDNQERVKTARKTLMFVIIGVAILILSKGIVSLTKSFLVVPPAATQVIKNIT